MDVLSHVKPQIWNCIDDHERRKSRAELLSPWADLTRKIVFIQGDTLYQLPRLGLDRINFAFLDAQHTKAAVLSEFAVVSSRMITGDITFFDDVTPAVFPGVVDAVDQIRSTGDYDVRNMELSPERSYAWARKK